MSVHGVNHSNHLLRWFTVSGKLKTSKCYTYSFPLGISWGYTSSRLLPDIHWCVGWYRRWIISVQCVIPLILKISPSTSYWQLYNLSSFYLFLILSLFSFLDIRPASCCGDSFHHSWAPPPPTLTWGVIYYNKCHSCLTVSWCFLRWCEQTALVEWFKERSRKMDLVTGSLAAALARRINSERNVKQKMVAHFLIFHWQWQGIGLVGGNALGVVMIQSFEC